MIHPPLRDPLVDPETGVKLAHAVLIEDADETEDHLRGLGFVE